MALFTSENEAKFLGSKPSCFSWRQISSKMHREKNEGKFVEYSSKLHFGWNDVTLLERVTNLLHKLKRHFRMVRGLKEKVLKNPALIHTPAWSKCSLFSPFFPSIHHSSSYSLQKGWYMWERVRGLGGTREDKEGIILTVVERQQGWIFFSTLCGSWAEHGG